MYAGDEYQDIARCAVAQLDRLAAGKGRCAFPRSGGDSHRRRVWKRPGGDGSRCLIIRRFVPASGNDANDGQKMTEITHFHIEMNLFYVHLIMYSIWKLLLTLTTEQEMPLDNAETNSDITVTPCSPNIGAISDINLKTAVAEVADGARRITWRFSAIRKSAEDHVRLAEYFVRHAHVGKKTISQTDDPRVRKFHYDENTP